MQNYLKLIFMEHINSLSKLQEGGQLDSMAMKWIPSSKSGGCRNLRESTTIGMEMLHSVFYAFCQALLLSILAFALEMVTPYLKYPVQCKST